MLMSDFLNQWSLKTSVWVVSVVLGVGGTNPLVAQSSAPTASENVGQESDLGALLVQAQSLQAQQRFAEALLLLNEIDEKHPNHPDVSNMRGSIYLTPGLRDFNLAEKYFRQAAELRPGTIAAKFNLAELAFVKHEWESSLKAFEELLKDNPRIPLVVWHLILFKTLICHLQLDQVADAEAILKRHFGFMDDTPAYYYAKAALQFHAKKGGVAADWLMKASAIFKKADNEPYLDTLMEVGWVPQIGISHDSKPGS